MAPLFSFAAHGRDDEKSPASGHNDHQDDDGSRSQPVFPDGFSLGAAGSRLADCLGSICPPCSPFETQPSGYAPLDPGPPAYSFDTTRPYPVQRMDVMQATPVEAYTPTTVAAAASPFTSETPQFSQYDLPQYPPLQPTRNIAAAHPMQPLGKRPEIPYADDVFARPDGRPMAGRTSADFDHVTATHLPPSMPKPTSAATLDASLLRTTPVQPMMAADGRQDYFAIHPTTAAAAAAAATAQARFAVPPPPSTCSQPPQDTRGESELQVVFPHQRPPRATRGPFKSHIEREKTARTRKIGSCIRCKMQRIRCNLDPRDEVGPCISCQKISNTKVFRVPCLRLKIVDIKLFKPGQVQGFEWTKRWENSPSGSSEISQWASNETKVIKVTEGYTGDAVLLKVREFVPQPGDKLARSWVSRGERKSVPIPPYAIVDLAEAERSYNKYIEKGIVECLKRVLGPREKLVWRTYALALSLAQAESTPPAEKALLSKTLYLWMSIRLSTKSCVIVGEETLGMSRDIMDQTSPLHGQIPLPPVMGAQIDSLLIKKIQVPTRRELLETLQKIIQSNKQKTWMTTYLVTFILLHNISLITKHDASYARKHGMTTRFAREDMVKEYHLGANTLLGYFHYCNKNVYPFSDACRDQELRTLAQLDEKEIGFVRYTRAYAHDHRSEWEQLHRGGEVEDDYYFVSQLYEENWLPRCTL